MNRVALILLLILSGAISVAAQKVRAEADPNVDLSRYKTYTWSQGMAGANALVNAQIVAEVDRALARCTGMDTRFRQGNAQLLRSSQAHSDPSATLPRAFRVHR